MSESKVRNRRPIRWWPALVVFALAILALVFVWGFRDVPRQEKNINTAVVLMITSALLVLWWCFFSRTRLLLRFGVIVSLAALIGIGSQVFEIVGVSGDLVPIVRLKSAAANEASIAPVNPIIGQHPDAEALPSADKDFLQFLGSDRNAMLSGISLSAEQMQSAPKEIWRQPIGQGWSGFVVEGSFAYTQEQSGTEESVTCYQLGTGKLVWRHDYPA